ncbi:M48 family metallopeptidase [Geomonas azotofigens]|uniref:M48 family metallopeptidase n=1 Tax=Geomonas azotofigens TaxID=2843196 RepID=UPI001C105B71|nr:M48 family metallopeptidase [Geomonas azotofigens]MBU5614894.1 M48 family metalloprotease [Geomonas azotofigens]
MKCLKGLFLPILLSLSLISGCAVNKSSVGGFNLISVAEEKQLGDKFAVEVEKQHQVVRDPEVQAYIEGVGRKLLTGVRKQDFPFTFQVVKDDSINAFAIPGGHTYVNTGLIKAAASETELAAVMAHEMNHVVARHSTRQMTQQYGYSLIVSLLLGGQGGELSKMAADLFGKAGGMYYSREMESQADYLGVETMYKAGYNPQGMVSFFKKLDATEERQPGKIAKYFSSHPETVDRIKDIQQEISTLPEKSWLPDSTPEFARVKAKVKNL